MNATRVTKMASIAAILVLAGYGAWSASGDAVSALAQESPPARNELHSQMHEMMGEGPCARMHDETPHSEQMMEACAAMISMMDDEMMEGMDGMMPADMSGGMMRGKRMGR